MGQKDWTTKPISERVKTYLASDQLKNLVFSYQIDSKSFFKDGTLVLQQQETGFSITLQLTATPEQLMVKKFTLLDNPQLGHDCLSLYDAAMVEIALQALDFLFVIAIAEKIAEIKFSVGKVEAEHLLSFDSFFAPISSKGAQNLLTLPTFAPAYVVFVTETGKVKTKIRHELWHRQRQEPLLRRYFQDHQKGTLFPLIGSMQNADPVAFSENVIAFPARPTNSMSL